MRKISLLLLLCLACLVQVKAQGILLENLRTEYMRNPVGIDVEKPRFSWQMKSDQRGTKQVAYQIKVATDASLENLVWDSGKIDSDKSIHIFYEGAPLSSSTRYYWSVVAWDEKGAEVTPQTNSFFETGLMNSGWGNAKWIKVYDGKELADENLTAYTLEMDFEIKDIAAGPCFAVKDPSNYFMWQISVKAPGKVAGRAYIRAHQWKNGGASCFKEVDITSKIALQKDVVYHLKIVVDGKKASTYINDILVDETNNPDNTNYGNPKIGFRTSFDNSDGNRTEKAYFDNVKVFAGDADQTLLFEEDFSNASNAKLAGNGGSVVDGRLYMDANTNADRHVWQVTQPAEPVRFDLEFDMILVRDNAEILFSAKDANNTYMWGINTQDNPSSPIIRRHIYQNGQVSFSDRPFSNYTKAQLLGTERRVKISVDNNVIKTYIDNVLVDTYTDTYGKLIYGEIGFRAFGSNTVHEEAYYDNVVLTNYREGEAPEVITDDFEDGSALFAGVTTTLFNGSNRLHVVTPNGDLRILSGSSVPMFRKNFTLTKEIESARIYSSALGVYDLFINGKRVGTPKGDGSYLYDELKPGWTDYNKTIFYTTYDVTGLLTTGANAIGAHVASGWFMGGVSHGDYGSHPLGFLSKLVVKYKDGTSAIIDTDTSWKSSTNSPIVMADIYNGEVYDARRESNWTEAGYNDSAWGEVGINTYFNGQVTAFVGPPVQIRPEMEITPLTVTVYEGTKANGKTHGEINTKQTAAGNSSIQLRKGETAVYNMGQNMVGWVKFTVKGAAGTQMQLRFGEMLNDNGDAGKGNDGPKGSVYLANLRSAKAMSYYTLKGDASGETYAPSLTFFGFQYCEITASQDVEIQMLRGEVVGNATEEGSTLVTSNPSVNQLYSNVLWGQRGNYLSIPTDCPQRDERLGWTGDTQVFCRAASYNADVSAFFHKWMGDMRDSQHTNGAYPSVAPYTWGVPFGAAAWGDAGIIVPWTVYLAYGNTGIIEENFESMEKYMAYLVTQAGGGYKYNGPGTDYGDWLSYEDTDRRYIAVAYYAYDAQLMAKMSKVLSKTTGDEYDQKATEYATLYDNIKKEFNTRYVNTDGSLKQRSQTAYLLALKYGLFPNQEAVDKAVTFLSQKITNNGNKLSTGFVGTGILNQTLSEFGLDNIAYNLLLQRQNPSWLYSVDQGATTIWERWNSYTIEGGFGDISMNSFNHYAYGAVSEWMYRYMAGIDADEAKPGFKHIILQPTPDNRTSLPAGQERMTSVSAKYPSYYGEISSEWTRKDDGRIIYKVTVPANTTATLYLPIIADDDAVFEGNALAETAAGVTFVESTDSKITYTLQSGTYTFEVKTKTNSSVAGSKIPASFKIYPNPVKTELAIAAEPTDFTIFDISGRTILSGNGTIVNVSGLDDGSYYVQTKESCSKFIKI